MYYCNASNECAIFLNAPFMEKAFNQIVGHIFLIGTEEFVLNIIIHFSYENAVLNLEKKSVLFTYLTSSSTVVNKGNTIFYHN